MSRTVHEVSDDLLLKREACLSLRNSDDFLLAHLVGVLELNAAAGP